MTAFKDRTGERFISNEGCEFVIIKYNTNRDLWIQFQDEYGTILHSNYSNCKQKSIKNPYNKSIYGVGCLGLMKDGSKPKTIIRTGVHSREYILWGSMMRRCYDSKFIEDYPTYEEATVCDRWLVFANFLEDLPSIEGYSLWLEHPKEQIALDKDIKGNGSKVYCLENCKFISNADNVKEVHKRYGKDFNESKRIKVYGINIKTGERTKDFNSIKEASIFIGIANPSNISECINNKRRTSGGYIWYKVEEDN